nr:MAG TPA: hypothetical protein [Caudoviricetes sp.]
MFLERQGEQIGLGLWSILIKIWEVRKVKG